jgi:hypothetical protein
MRGVFEKWWWTLNLDLLMAPAAGHCQQTTNAHCAHICRQRHSVERALTAGRAHRHTTAGRNGYAGPENRRVPLQPPAFHAPPPPPLLPWFVARALSPSTPVDCA